MLIEFIEDKNDSEETWRGYVYAASMFVSAILQSLVLQQYFHIMFTLGMRVRSSVIGLLYEKVSINEKILHSFFFLLFVGEYITGVESICTGLRITRKQIQIIRGFLYSCCNLLIVMHKESINYLLNYIRV